MQHPTENILRTPTVNSHFLCYQTGRAPEPSYREPQARLDRDIPDIVDIPQLADRFPGLLIKDAFINAAMDRVADAPAFAALVIKIDDIHHVLHPDRTAVRAAEALKAVCEAEDGSWGLLAPDTLGAVFPNKTEAQGLALIQSLREMMAGQGRETISAGLSVYPTLSYDRGRILENAAKALDHAAFFGPNSHVAFDAVSLNISGDNYYQAGDLETAMNEYRLALSLDRDNVNVHNSLGVCYGVRGEMGPALQEFEAAIRLAPDDIMALYNTGYIYFLKNDYETALSYFQRAEGIDPDVFELAIQTGRTCLALDEPETACRYLESAVRLNPRSAPAFRLLGDAYSRMDRWADATTNYKTALKLNPQDAEALSALGYLYETLGKNEDIALVFCRQACELSPETSLFHQRLGRLYENRNRLEEALEAFEKAKELGYPDDENIIRVSRQLQKERQHADL